MKKFAAIAFALLPLFGIAQEEKDFGIKFSGFVKNDAFFDSRQVTSAREGHFLLYPNAESLDVDGVDINATPSFNMLAIQTRLTGKITGPDAFGAKTSGVLEGAFFGHTDADINGFRLRHAFVKLNWEKSELLLGQYWHPMFVPECFPNVMSFNTGVPFQPFSRNPQIRFTYSVTPKIRIMAAALAQRDFASPGGSTSLRNSPVPDMQLQFQYGDKKEGLLAGLTGGYKMLRPRLVTDSMYKADELVAAMSAQVFLTYRTEKYTCRLEGVYGQNMYDLLMLGGYAVKYDTLATNLAVDHREYTPLNTMSAWFEFQTNGKKLQAGLFGGYTLNMGSDNNIRSWSSASSYSARGANIHHVYRVSPRVVLISGKVKFALEGEYTVAGYGNTRNSLGEVLTGPTTDYPDAELKEVANIRALFSVIYSF